MNEKDCSNCKYEEQSAKSNPCSKCSRNGQYDGWGKQTEQYTKKEITTMNKKQFYFIMLDLFNKAQLTKGKRQLLFSATIATKYNELLTIALRNKLITVDLTASTLLITFTHRGVLTMNKVRRGMRHD